MTETEKYSFKGWQFKQWARHNKETFKALVILVAGYSYLVDFDWKVFLLAVAGVASKLVVDSIDYWLKE